MDFTKLLQSLEELVFEAACLVVLIPKTFFTLALFPRRTFDYVTAELKKPVEERFDSNASPLILWFVTGLMPHFLTLSIFASLPELKALLPTDQIVTHLLHLAPESRFTALSVFAVSLPIALAFVVAREQKLVVAKTSLRGPLYSFCYCLAPQFFAAVPLWYFWEAQQRGVHANITVYMEAYIDVVTVWFVYTTLALLRLHLNVGWKRGFVLLGKAFLVFMGVMMLLELAIIFIVELAHM